MQKLVLVIGLVFSPLLAMELARFDERPCVGNLLVRPDGIKLSDLSLSELQDSHPKVVDAGLYPFLEKIIAESHFTGKFWLKKSGSTDEFWHNNRTLSNENALDGYLILLAKNGRCKVSKPMKHDVIGIRAFSSVADDKYHNWSYFKKAELASLNNENLVVKKDALAIEVAAKNAQREKNWSIFEGERRESEMARIETEMARCEEEDAWADERAWLEVGAGVAPGERILQRQGDIIFIPLRPPFEPAPQSIIERLQNRAYGICSWCVENPKKTFGLAIGTGVLSWLAYKNYIGEEPVQKAIQFVQEIKPVQYVVESVQQVTQPIQQAVESVPQVIEVVQQYVPNAIYGPAYTRGGLRGGPSLMGLRNGIGLR